MYKPICGLVLGVFCAGAALAGEPAPAAPQAASAAALPVEEGLFTVMSSVPVRLYGYVKLDASWDDSRVSDGNFARWVESEDTNKNDSEFNMTARQTRLGLKFGKQEVDGVGVSGLVEIDFYGNGNVVSENKPEPMLRHAYMELDWAGHDFKLLAGQTSDVIGPLNPDTLNYTVLWWNGNTGYRRPQIRLTKGFAFDGLLQRVELQAAATRNIGHDGPFDPGDTGEDAGGPGLQWRAAASFDLLTDKPTVLGVSGSWHAEEYDLDNEDDDSEDFDSNSINLDLTLPVFDWLSFKAELYCGKNLDTFLGGVGQGVNATTIEEVSSKGGWASATMTARKIEALKDFTFNVGVGLDDPDNGDLNDGDRSRNLGYFGNAVYAINRLASVGAEVTRLQTDYIGQDEADATRVQLSFVYKF
jgi:hypothetical protein